MRPLRRVGGRRAVALAALLASLAVTAWAASAVEPSNDAPAAAAVRKAATAAPVRAAAPTPADVISGLTQPIPLDGPPGTGILQSARTPDPANPSIIVGQLVFPGGAARLQRAYV